MRLRNRTSQYSPPPPEVLPAPFVDMIPVVVFILPPSVVTEAIVLVSFWGNAVMFNTQR